MEGFFIAVHHYQRFVYVKITSVDFKLRQETVVQDSLKGSVIYP